EAARIGTYLAAPRSTPWWYAGSLKPPQIGALTGATQCESAEAVDGTTSTSPTDRTSKPTTRRRRHDAIAIVRIRCPMPRRLIGAILNVQPAPGLPRWPRHQQRTTVGDREMTHKRAPFTRAAVSIHVNNSFITPSHPADR